MLISPILAAARDFDVNPKSSGSDAIIQNETGMREEKHFSTGICRSESGDRVSGYYLDSSFTDRYYVSGIKRGISIGLSLDWGTSGSLRVSTSVP